MEAFGHTQSLSATASNYSSLFPQTLGGGVFPLDSSGPYTVTFWTPDTGVYVGFNSMPSPAVIAAGPPFHAFELQPNEPYTFSMQYSVGMAVPFNAATTNSAGATVTVLITPAPVGSPD